MCCGQTGKGVSAPGTALQCLYLLLIMFSESEKGIKEFLRGKKSACVN